MSATFVQQFIVRSDKCRSLAQDAFLFHQGDPVNSVFVVEEGLIELVRQQQDGKSLVLQRAVCHSALAEASVYSDNYHCAAIAALPSRVFELRKSAFLACLQEDMTFFGMWASHLAREVQAARYRSEILSLKTVAERLDSWLSWPGNHLPEKGQWKNIAVQIGVSPEALYRELSLRQRK